MTHVLVPEPRQSAATSLRNVGIIFRRELAAYFATPLAYVFILIFLVLAGWFTFYLGGFFEREQADLEPFFVFHPWLYLFLIPAISMRLWSEERRSGSVELLMTQPITLWQAVVGKFLAAWACAGLALALTFPIWITVDYLGHPDNGAILTGYLGSFLMAGAFLAVGSCMSALTRNTVVAFILGVAACFALLLAGLPMVLDAFRSGWALLVAGALLAVGACVSALSRNGVAASILGLAACVALLLGGLAVAPEAFRGWMPPGVIEAVASSSSAGVVDAVASVSFLTHFEAIAKGVVDLRDVFFFALTIVCFLAASVILLDLHKSE